MAKAWVVVYTVDAGIIITASGVIPRGEIMKNFKVVYWKIIDIEPQAIKSKAKPTKKPRKSA